MQLSAKVIVDHRAEREDLGEGVGECFWINESKMWRPYEHDAMRRQSHRFVVMEVCFRSRIGADKSLSCF